MKNFGRVLRLALRYRFTFLASVVCAFAVAGLWGANIGTVYPFFEVAFKNQSLHEWVDTKIDESQRVIDLRQAEITRLTKDRDAAAGADRDAADVKLRLAGQALDTERQALARYEELSPFIKKYMPAKPFTTVIVLVGILFIGTLVKGVFVIAHTILVARLAELGTFRLRKLFYRRTLAMDLASFNDEGTSDLMSRFTFDMETVSAGLDSVFGKLVREPLKAIVCLAGAAWICWRLLLLSMIVAPLAAYLIRWLAKMLKRANRRAMEEMALLYNRLEETFRGIKVVKAFACERHERWRFHLSSKDYFRRAMKIARYDSLTRPVTELMGILTICLALLAGAHLVLSGQTHLFGVRMMDRSLDLASLLVFFALLAGTADPVRKLSDIFSRLQRAAAASDRIFAMLDREATVRDPEKPVALGRHSRDLVVENVTFAYRSGEQVLKGVSLSIRAGETIALVGPNGCGKTTLLNLLPRFADPTSGEIRLDGVPLAKAKLRDIRRQIGLVSQETLLFDDTVMNNIRYGSPRATDEDVVNAAKQAHAHRFIDEDLPDGYNTVVGASGNRLSGGQRQRIALARAILRDPSILLLDEATSQVDLQSEQLIQSVLEKFTRDRTTIIITHRLGVLELADRIVVMDAGRILDTGTHEELMTRCESYRRLYAIQFGELRQTG